jgi:transposase/predicted RNA-binding Zn-ribbon protein involved in translation (DUF1610 family)
MDQQTLDDIVTGSASATDEFYCPTCGDDFASKHGVKSHHKQVHDEELDEVPGSSGEHNCPTCGDTFDSERGVKIHHSHVHDEPLEPSVGADWLSQQYVERGRPTTEIAEECDVSVTTVQAWMDRCGIELRDMSEAKAEGDISRLQDPDWLREQYQEKGRSMVGIAEECGLDITTVETWLDRHGIEKRSLSEQMADGEVHRLQDAEWLQEQYQQKGRSGPDIADECGVAVGTVYSWLERHGLKRRDRHEAQADGDIKPLRDPDWLRSQYWEKGRTASEIAEECGVYDSTVNRWLDRHGIDRKGQSVARSGESVRKLEDPDWLYNQYHEQGLSTPDIAEKYGVTPACVGDWMDRHGIDRRGRKGEDNPMWKGGANDYYGPSWYAARRQARERDGYTCQRCGMTDEEHLEEYHQELHVHHIQPFRTFQDHQNANKLDNLITLCRDCHDSLEGLPIES